MKLKEVTQKFIKDITYCAPDNNWITVTNLFGYIDGEFQINPTIDTTEAVFKHTQEYCDALNAIEKNLCGDFNNIQNKSIIDPVAMLAQLLKSEIRFELPIKINIGVKYGEKGEEYPFVEICPMRNLSCTLEKIKKQVSSFNVAITGNNPFSINANNDTFIIHKSGNDTVPMVFIERDHRIGYISIKVNPDFSLAGSGNMKLMSSLLANLANLSDLKQLN